MTFDPSESTARDRPRPAPSTARGPAALRDARAALHRYDFILNSITDPVSVIDADVVYHVVNDAWCRATGMRREDVIGRVQRALIERVASPECVRALGECLADRQPRRVRSLIDFDRTGLRWWETTMNAYDAPGAPGPLVVLITRDVDAQERAQANLAAGVDNLRITLNATGDAIFASDAATEDQPLLFANDRVLEMFRVPPDEVTSLTPARAMAFASRYFIDPVAEVARLRAIIAGGELVEDRLTLNDGRTLLLRCEPTVAGGRRVRVWTFRDISAEAQGQRALAEAEAQQRALLEAFPGYIACVDADLRYSYVNAPLAALSGKLPAELVGRTVREVAPPESAELTVERARRALAGETLSYERSYAASGDGETRHVMYTLTPGAERGTGRPQCTVFGTDVTSLKRTEAALIRARDEAEQANHAKSAFLSSMSHELRTPMNAVLGFAQLLAADTTLGEAQREKVRRIGQGGQHLLALINDLLDLARIESGRMELQLEPLALPALVAHCLSLVAADAAQRGVVLLPFDAGLPALTVLADKRRLQQVLLNLLGNAIKYNREGGWVRIHWSAEGGHACCTVSDSGPGIDAARQQQLFQWFERLDADRGGVEGTGIGLALCRRLLHQMDGAIGVDSSPGRGSSFWFTLALDGAAPGARLPVRQSAPDAPRPPAQIAVARQRRVLCIEDNPVNLLLIEAMVESLPGTSAQGATDPRVGLGLALADPPDLVLLDIQMPGMDGYEVLRRLREAPATRALPVIAVSANAMPQDVARGLAAGFSDYLTKPVPLPALIRAVEHALAGGSPGA